MVRRPAKKTIESRLVGVEQGIRSLQASDAAIIRSMRDGFSQMESSFDQIYNHVDGFMKLHETPISSSGLSRNSAAPRGARRTLGSYRKKLKRSGPTPDPYRMTHNPVSVVRFLLFEEARYLAGANIHLGGASGI